MSYIVFARKYRPQDFDQIIGQSHITTTLKNAIAGDRVAHAYLFAGPRGVGKTTTARILAKALNCEKGPSANPCNTCPSCLEITSGSSLDIFEIDGASNRGIDEIRSLRENAKFMPTKGRFKLYIIDEVHMLTPEAFNALLKTLEEPPPHVKFIFATTHAHKVPPTILSRCQRFDFRRIPTKEILDNLKKIMKDEKISVDDEALALIARYGDGSMRDSQVILDQIASFTQGSITADDVVKVLGTVGDEALFGISGSIADRNTRAALELIDRLVGDGKDVAQVVSELIEHFRNIAVAKVSDDAGSLIDSGAEKVARYAEDAKRFTIEQILYIIYTLSNTIDFMRKTDMARIPFEAALVKLTQDSGIVPIAQLLKRVEALESGMPHRGALVKSVQKISEHAVESGIVAPEVPDVKVPEVKAPENIVSAKRSSNLDEILSSWMQIISYIKTKKISSASYLQEGDPISLEGGVLTIGFAREFQFHKEVLESNENKKLIEQAIKETIGSELRVVFALTGPVSVNGRGTKGYTADPDDADGGIGEAGDDTDPIVKKALEMFDGKLTAEGNNKEKAR